MMTEFRQLQPEIGMQLSDVVRREIPTQLAERLISSRVATSDLARLNSPAVNVRAPCGGPIANRHAQGLRKISPLS
ncbi:hypothetical protein FSB08_25335 [Paraburkholderia sp. JPY432]|nr:hypothetical protein [Paraburkholderia youngii]